MLKVGDLPPSLAKFIATRDARLVKAGHYLEHELLDNFLTLLNKGEITVGGRSTCGTYVDFTWKRLQAWREIIVKACRRGYKITDYPLKQDNRWATLAGGFWHESIFKYELTEEITA